MSSNRTAEFISPFGELGDNDVELISESEEDKAALESLLKSDMNDRLERWRDAWQTGLADYYLDFYSENFQPSGNLTLAEWVEQRKFRISPDKAIKIQLSNFEISFSNEMNLSTVLFDQQYSSQGYSERSRKKTIWVKEESEWKIISEAQVE